jgi:hypothetical protein
MTKLRSPLSTQTPPHQNTTQPQLNAKIKQQR